MTLLRQDIEDAVTGAAAIEKAFMLVDRIAAAPSPPTAAELQMATGLPRSTLFRLLSVLEARGYTRRVARGWQLGFRLFELAQSAWRGFDLADAAQEEIAKLPEATGETMQSPPSSRRAVAATRSAPTRETVSQTSPHPSWTSRATARRRSRSPDPPSASTIAGCMRSRRC